MNDKTFTLTFTAQELDVIAAGLNELPIKVGLPTLQKLVKQIQETPTEAVATEE